jgi:hypothetical protein
MTSTRPVMPAVSDLVRLEEVCELAAPVAAASERLRTVVEELKTERTRAVADLRRAVLNLGHDCPIDQRAELARILYWRHTEIPITDITAAFGFHNQTGLLAVVGAVRSQATCEDCAKTLIATSRRQLADLDKLAAPTRYGPQALCRPCRDRRERSIFDEPPEELYHDDPEAWDEVCYHDDE